MGGAPSVTVAADSVALADAWATALTAMPYEQAIAIAEKQNIAALFVLVADSMQPKADSTLSTEKDSFEEWQVIQTAAMQTLRADKKS